MKFLAPYYSCLQNPWLGGYRSQIPVLCPLSSTEFVEPPPPNKIPGYATDFRCTESALLLFCLPRGVHSDIFSFTGLFEEFVIVDESVLMRIHNYAVICITPPTSWRQRACRDRYRNDDIRYLPVPLSERPSQHKLVLKNHVFIKPLSALSVTANVRGVKHTVDYHLKTKLEELLYAILPDIRKTKDFLEGSRASHVCPSKR